MRYSDAIRRAQADAVARLLDDASMRVLATDGRVLAVLRLRTPSAPPAVDGHVAIHDPMPVVATATGLASRVEIATPTGVLVSGDIGADFTINGAAISDGAQVRCSGLTLTVR